MAESSEAREKFANAKAISSDMFFGREANAEVCPRCLLLWNDLGLLQIKGGFIFLMCKIYLFQYEVKTRLEGMSSSTSISSAELFGDGSTRPAGEPDSWDLW